MVADQGWGPAPSLREHFVILRERGVIDAATESSLGAGVKVRNLIAHGYAEVDRDKLHAAASALGPLVERYCALVLDWVQRQP